VAEPSRPWSVSAQNGVKVVVGATVDTPENLVTAYLAGSLVSGANICDH
jgi:hypothetical protein